MGRNGLGVEVRETSIRLSFTFEGRQYRRTLKVNGQPISPTPANVGFAERLAAEIRSRIKFGTFSMREYFSEDDTGTGVVTVGQQLDTWLSTLQVAHSTRAGYSSAVRFWQSAACDKYGKKVGDLPLRTLLTSHVLAALASRPNLSGKTRNNYLGVLQDALEAAVTDRVLEINPASKVPKAKHQKLPPDPFSREESEAILQKMGQLFPGHVFNMAEFWFWSGLRTGELLGLTWTNVDLEHGIVHVRESLVRGQYKGSTKTNVARRVIMNSRSRAALERQSLLTQAKGATVFYDPRTSTGWANETAFLKTYWVPVLKRLNVRYRRPYNCRHTYATQMLMAGMNPAFCAGQLGHSVEIFLGTYSRWLDGDRNALEMGRLEASISG